MLMAGAISEHIENVKESVLEAYFYAKQAHLGQKRKTGEEYITHPVAVANILGKYGADDPTLAAALLHDVVEDTPVTIDDIREKFGDEVAFLVDGATKEGNSEQTLNKIREYAAKDTRVLLVKLADRMHNLQTKIDNNGILTKYQYSTREFLIPLARSYGLNTMAGDLEKLLEKAENGR